MRLYEYEAKRLLIREGMIAPRMYGLAASPGELQQLKISFPAMVKAQVLMGGRGKAGGIKKTHSAQECAEAVNEILRSRIAGYPVETVLIEEALEFKHACYLGVTMDPATANNIVIVGTAGGIEIEEVARSSPEALLRIEIAGNPESLSAADVVRIRRFFEGGLGAESHAPEWLANTLRLLYGAYQKYDCKLLEVNPLLVTETGPVAADAKMVLDDNALFRQQGLLQMLGLTGMRHETAEPTRRELAAAAAGFPYVDLLPEDAAKEPGKIYVGLVPGGAGYGIFSIDELINIGNEVCGERVVPLNFMDSGGGPSTEAVEAMFNLMMDHPLVDLIITSRFGGISSCDIFVRGLVNCLRSRMQTGRRLVPVYGRMVGTDLPSAREFLKTAREETPDALSGMTMVVGNERIMADVIREALVHFASVQKEAH